MKKTSLSHTLLMLEVDERNAKSLANCCETFTNAKGVTAGIVSASDTCAAMTYLSKLLE